MISSDFQSFQFDSVGLCQLCAFGLISKLFLKWVVFPGEEEDQKGSNQQHWSQDCSQDNLSRSWSRWCIKATVEVISKEEIQRGSSSIEARLAKGAFSEWLDNSVCAPATGKCSVSSPQSGKWIQLGLWNFLNVLNYKPVDALSAGWCGKWSIILIKLTEVEAAQEVA